MQEDRLLSATEQLVSEFIIDNEQVQDRLPTAADEAVISCTHRRRTGPRPAPHVGPLLPPRPVAVAQARRREPRNPCEKRKRCAHTEDAVIRFAAAYSPRPLGRTDTPLATQKPRWLGWSPRTALPPTPSTSSRPTSRCCEQRLFTPPAVNRPSTSSPPTSPETCPSSRRTRRAPRRRFAWCGSGSGKGEAATRPSPLFAVGCRLVRQRRAAAAVGRPVCGGCELNSMKRRWVRHYFLLGGGAAVTARFVPQSPTRLAECLECGGRWGGRVVMVGPYGDCIQYEYAEPPLLFPEQAEESEE